MNNPEIPQQVSICLPVLNESEVITKVLSEWIHVLDQLPRGSQILIEDGGSTDGTTEILREISSNDSRINVMYRDKPDGFGSAAKRLLGAPTSGWVFFTDSDGQYVAEDFWKLWERRQDYDFIRGIKLGRQDPFFRRVGSLLWNKSARFLFELPVSDLNAAFLLMRAELLRELLPSVRILRTMILSELIIRAVMHNASFGRDIYIFHRARESGKSRATPGIKYLMTGLSQIRGLFQIKSDYRIR